jgi:polysaccharide biosynthesis transport protein
MQFSTRDGLPRTLLFTSGKPSEGKTTTAINTAKSLSQIGLRILLIDGDLRNPSIHRRLNLTNELGLSNYLSGNSQPEDVARATDDGRMVLMTSGPLPPNPAELLSGPRMPSLLALASESFDIVIIDGPPVVGLADAPILANLVQATLMVVAAGETRRNVVRTALRRLSQAQANIVGVVLNKFDIQIAAYGYGYGDYTYYTYGKDQDLTKDGA